MQGKEYPKYVTIQLEPIPQQGRPPERDRRLVVRMDGGKAAVSSPTIPVSSSFSYLISSRLYLERAEGYEVRVVISTHDRSGKPRDRMVVVPQSIPDRWQTVSFGPWAIEDAEVRTVAIGLEIEPLKPDALFAVVQWDDIRLWALPRMRLEADRRLPYYHQGERPTIRCQLFGLQTPQAQVSFSIRDFTDREVYSETRAVHLSATSAAFPLPSSQSVHTYSGSLSWEFPVSELGYYRIVAQVRQADKPLLSRELALAVLDSLGTGSARGNFGWTFPSGTYELSVRDIPDLASWAGLQWVKYPVWFDEKQSGIGDELAWLAERLAARGAELVGLLDQPPAGAVRQLSREVQHVPAALVFRDPEIWQNWLSPVMTRLSLRVRWWQLGSDHDYSHAGYRQTEQQVRSVKQFFERFGQEPHLVLPWNWMDEPLPVSQPPWDHLSFGVQPTLTSEELARYVGWQRAAGMASWVVLEPLDQSYPLTTRAAELIRTIVSALQAGADAVFVPNPFDPDRGLVDSNGAPRPLFLPWYTTAQLLGSLPYAGSLSLPHQSTNFVFGSEAHWVVVLWNDRPVKETLYVGASRHVRMVNMWGQPVMADLGGAPAGRVDLDVTPAPLFLVVQDAPAIRWQLNTVLVNPQLETGLGQEQTLQLRFRNTFGQGIAGQLTVHTPNSWIVQPNRLRFLAAPDEELQLPIRVLLRPTAASGDQAIDFDFEVEASTVHAFRVHRVVRVGEHDITIRLYPAWNESGDLVIEQEFHNLSDRNVSFNCVLFVPGKGRYRRQVLYLGPGRRVDFYVIPDGTDLRGQSLWLRATEIGGTGRILNYELPLPP